jgi:putative phage-type endonuclease
MNTIDALQGTNEWLAARAGCFTASEAPAMMGASKYQTRSDLLKQKATGLAKDVDEGTQRLFDRGHAAEAAARPIVEGIIGETLYPVTGWIEVDGMRLLASFDGLTDIEDKAWESKLWNAALADAVRAGQLEPHYYWQLEQQLLVSGAERIYFTTSDGTPENTVGMWYEAVPGRREKLIAGWKQFAEDLANYQHVETAPAPVAATIEALPALFVQVEGKVLATNLEAFKQAAQTFIDGIKTELVNDQDFADADKMVKFLKDGEERLALAKSQALAQTASIDELFRTVDAISEQMKAKRLALNKLVDAEKANRKAEIVRNASDILIAHFNSLNERIGGKWMPTPNSLVFSDAIKGLKSLDSMRDKVAGALAQAKVEANEIADRIEKNIRWFKEYAKGYEFLFPDLNEIVALVD